MNDPAIDAIYVATPLTTHFDYVKLSLLKNKNVLCEKPLFSEYSNYTEVKRIADENNLFVMEGIWPLYIPLIKFIKNTTYTGSGYAIPLNKLEDLEIEPIN